MKLSKPFLISSRLLPAVKIADCTISLDPQTDRYYFDMDGGMEFSGDDFHSPACAKGKDVQHSMAALLGFVSAFAEGLNYESRNLDHKSENSDLFPFGMREWATQNSDEISMLAYELEEGERVVAY
jgi:hypothetical protein